VPFYIQIHKIIAGFMPQQVGESLVISLANMWSMMRRTPPFFVVLHAYRSASGYPYSSPKNEED